MTNPLLYVFLIVVVPLLLLWGALSPRSQWRVLQGWRYRHPEANEPSNVAYQLFRRTAGQGLTPLE